MGKNACRLQTDGASSHLVLTCVVPDRESNGTKYLREATELIEEWQHQLLSGQPMSGPPSEHGEVILVGRGRREGTAVLSRSLSENACVSNEGRFVINWREDTSC